MQIFETKGKSGETPVVIFSASPSGNELIKEAGADGFSEKPLNKKTLLEIIEKLTAES